MNIFYRSDIGKVRKTNEDSYLIVEKDDYTLLIIADGMGGHKAGEVASKIAVDSIKLYFENKYEDNKDFGVLLTKAIKFANQEINKKSKESEEYFNMGTTVEACILTKEKLIIGHVGDSRVYYFNNKELKQITKDHSLFNDLIDHGNVSVEEAKEIGHKNIITRALGGEEKVKVDIFTLDTKYMNGILICTDGITSMVSDDDIFEILKSDYKLEEKTNLIVDKANENGGRDNSTIIIVGLR